MSTIRPPSKILCDSCWSALSEVTKVHWSFPPLLSNVIIPSEDEACNIRRDIAEAQSKLSRLTAQITTLEPLLAQLFQDQLQLQKDLHRYKALVSPLNRFPPELLSEVFTWCRPKESDPTVPINIAQVCARWRAIVLATPRFWSSINMVLRDVKDRPWKDAMIVSTWLTRSAESPLTLTFTFYDSAHPAVKAVIRHSRRWGHIHFSCHSRQSLRLFAIVKGRLPLLQSLNIRVATNDDTAVGMFKLAPQLHTVRFRNNFDRVKLPWVQLTHVDLLLSTERCLTLLRHCSALVDVTFGLHPPDGYVVTPIRLPHLHSLCIASWQSLANFFDSLVLPSLHKVRVETLADNPVSWTQSHFNSLLFRSSCSLEMVHFKEVLTEGDLIQCVQNIPSLVELQIKESWGRLCVGNDVLSLLTCGGSKKSVVPKLQSIRLYGPLAFDDLQFVEMIHSRWQGGVGSLRLIQLILQRELDDDAILGLKRLRDEGLEVYIL